MKFLTPSIFFTSLRVASAATGVKFYYNDQSQWPAVPATPEGTNVCDGQQQSPINIDTGDFSCQANAQGYSFYTGDCTLGDYEFTMNDHGLKASVEKSNCEKPKMIIPGTGKVYEVLQFHIHTGCENKFNNTGCDAELHLVHIAKTDIALPAATTSADLPDLAVLGLMMYGVDEKHASVDALIDSWSEVSCSNQKCMTVSDELKSQKFSPYSLIPSDTSIYNFQGSLTTPPCWEVVTWNVAEKPIKMSFKQVLAITNLINKYSGYRAEDGSCVADSTVADDAGITSRDVQPLNGRQIVKNCEPLTIMSDFPAAAQEQSPMTASSESSAQILSIKNIFGVATVLASIVLF